MKMHAAVRTNGASVVLIVLCFVSGTACARSESPQRPNADVVAGGVQDSLAGYPGFLLVNRTGATIEQIYLSPGTSAGWEENILGEGMTLRSGKSIDIRLNPQEKARDWDLKIVATSDTAAEWRALRIDRASRITLRIEMLRGLDVVADVQ